MVVEVVVPWRGGCPHREAALPYIVGRYSDLQHPIRITVADAPPGPWVKAAAVMPAVEASTADVVVVADADVWCDRTIDAIAAVADGRADWAIPHQRTHRLSRAATELVLVGLADITDPSLQLAEPSQVSAVGGGIVVASRSIILDVPLDHRFEGWGQEDFAWGLALRLLAGKPWAGAGPLFHLWHPPQPRQSRIVGSGPGWSRFVRYIRAHNAGDADAMSALVDEGRTRCP